VFYLKILKKLELPIYYIFKMEKQPKVLVLSRNSWNNSNNTGNTLSNIFQNWRSENIANVYCRDEIPNNEICDNYFKISERSLILKLIGKIKTTGINHSKIKFENFSENSKEAKNQKKEKKFYDFFRKNRWYLILWLRELLWKLAPWKSNEFLKFISDFKPEIIYAPSYDSFYMHSILYYIHKNSEAKVVLFHCDDLVTYRQFSFSIFYWINRFVLRQYMNKSIALAEKNYCIIDEQARVYEELYNNHFDLLYKTGDFEIRPHFNKSHPILKLVYTGNIIYGRIDSLKAIAIALQNINKDSKKADLYIYTTNKIEEKDRNYFLATKCVSLMGGVTYDEIPAILSDASVLIHVESFEKHQKLATSLSFSTKLVDYFVAGKSIFAIGWESAASILYLSKNNLGLTVTNVNDLQDAIQVLVDNSSDLEKSGNQIWSFGHKYHKKSEVLNRFEEELKLMIS
jgi:hypothetical protein